MISRPDSLNFSERGLKMITKRVGGIVLVMIFFAMTSYAGEIVQEQALQYYNEGLKAQKTGDFDNAKTAYQKAIMLAEGARKDIIKAIYNNFGVMYINMDNWEAAAQYFSDALSIDPDYKEANFNLGIFYAKMGEAEKALSYWGKALDKTKSYLLDSEKN
jgi:tetratricopeptide (TPR) repeat protein